VSAPARRLLLVSHRPLGYGGGGSVRWRFLGEALPELGWSVSTVSARAGATTNEFSTDPRRARLAGARARVMGRAGAVARPLSRRLAGVEPEALAPSIAWSLMGRRAVRRAIEEERPQVVWATGPPVAALFAAAHVAPAGGVPLVCELRDLWAGNPYYDAGGSLLPRAEARALREADAVVCVTPEARERLTRIHPELEGRVHVLPNGFDPRLTAVRGGAPSIGADGRVTIVHAGALYGGRSVDALIEGLGRTDLRGRARLELLGAAGGQPGGARGGVEVVTTPPVPWEEAIERTRAADIVLVIFTPGDDTAVPGKLYEALALGKPILALTTEDSATERLLRRLGLGAGCARHDDPRSIAAAVEALVHDPPAPAPVERLAEWDRASVARRVAHLLDELVER
jgi:glycosyltransferase involved in cell wall biosynthesis